MSKSFNVVIATAGRPTLQRMVDSIAPQLSECDYLTIIWDCEPFDLNIETKATCLQIANPEPLGFWGHGSRTRWQNELPGDYLLNGDDDDEYFPTAMDTIREHCTEEKLYVFKMMQSSIVIPFTEEIKMGNIGTPCGVYPNTKDLPEWGGFYGGDFQFYFQLSMHLPVEFVNRVIYLVRQDRDRSIPEKPVRFCDCGMEVNTTLDPMLSVWIGFCSRCQKELR
jgi:hypothetical protein